MKKLSKSAILSKGFTLIELLIVIAVIGVLAAAVWIALDPQDKIRAANDSKVQADLGSIAQAEEAYATTKNGFYSGDQAALVTNGDLKMQLTAPSGYMGYTDVGSPAACTSGTTCTSVIVCGELKSKKYVNAATPRWTYCSSSGKAGAVADCTTCL